MSDLGKLRAGAKEAIGKTSSWQRWLTLPPLSCLQCPKMESGDRGKGFLAVETDFWNLSDEACQTTSTGDLS